MNEEQKFIESLPTSLARKIYQNRVTFLSDLKRRGDLITAINQLFATELCPYSPGQIVGRYLKKASRLTHAMIFAVTFRREQPFYGVMIRDYDPDSRQFLSPPYPTKLQNLIGSVKFAPTEEFCEKSRLLYEAGEIGQIAMTPDQISQVQLFVTNLIERVAVGKLSPEQVQAAQLLSERLSYLGRKSLLDFASGGSITAGPA